MPLIVLVAKTSTLYAKDDGCVATILELLKKYDTKLWPCFYGFSSVQSGSLSKNNVEKAPLIGVDIEEAKYNDIQKTFKLD